MRFKINSPSWYDNLWAALIFFTRLPLGKIYQPPKESYTAVVEYWPLTGWLTSIVMASVLYFGEYIFPHVIAVILAIGIRILLTGALHEDGLADFFDGIGGGGNNPKRILEIMKDSRIGTFGVLALVIYLILLFLCLMWLPASLGSLTIIAADPFAKMLSSQATMMLPYAREVEESKSGQVYRKMSVKAGIFLFLQGILPLAVFLFLCKGCIRWDVVIFVPGVVMYFLYLLILRKIKGYTGDCCGAIFLIIELTFYLSVVAQYHINGSLWRLFS